MIFAPEDCHQRKNWFAGLTLVSLSMMYRLIIPVMRVKKSTKLFVRCFHQVAKWDQPLYVSLDVCILRQIWRERKNKNSLNLRKITLVEAFCFLLYHLIADPWSEELTSCRDPIEKQVTFLYTLMEVQLLKFVQCRSFCLIKWDSWFIMNTFLPTTTFSVNQKIKLVWLNAKWNSRDDNFWQQIDH